MNADGRGRLSVAQAVSLMVAAFVLMSAMLHFGAALRGAVHGLDHAEGLRRVTGEPLGPACSNGYVAGLLWIAPPTEPVIAYYLQGEGWYPQWIPFRDDPDTDDLVPLTEEESMNLLISESCSF